MENKEKEINCDDEKEEVVSLLTHHVKSWQPIMTIGVFGHPGHGKNLCESFLQKEETYAR
jgi:hypothetical protein